MGEIPAVSLAEVRTLASVFETTMRQQMPPRAVAAWRVRLGDMFVQAGSWMEAMRHLSHVPRGYLRYLPDDAEADPELAARAGRLAAWMEAQWGLQPGLDEPVQVYLEPGRA